MQLIGKADIEGTPGVDRFRRETRKFYTRTLKHMKKFPLTNKLTQYAVIVDSAASQTASLSRTRLACWRSCPGDLIPQDERDAICREFLSYQSATNLPAQDGRVDAFWVAIAGIKEPTTDEAAYPTLVRPAKHMLLVPHSNAYCETLFSMVQRIPPI